MKKQMTLLLTLLFIAAFATAQSRTVSPSMERQQPDETASRTWEQSTRDATLLFNQAYHDGGTAATSALDPAEGLDYEVADNFFGVDEPINEIIFYGLTLKFVGSWQELVPASTEPFFIRFYEYVEEYVPGLEAPVSGTYQVELRDSYGDGWNGGLLTVYVNGVPVLSQITMNTGAGPVYFSFTAQAGDEISTLYVPGSWSYENYYAIIAPGGNVIAEEGGTASNPGASTPGSIAPGQLTALEPQWNNPIANQYVTANVETVGMVWGGDYMLYRFTATLNTAVNLSEAWVSAQIDVANGSGTWFLWMNSLQGDDLSFQRTVPAKGTAQTDITGRDDTQPNFTREAGHPASHTSKSSPGFTRDILNYDMAFELWNTQPEELYNITLFVQDYDNDPIAGANVSIAGQQLTTGANGQVSIQLADGNYTAIATAQDYLEGTTAFTVDGDDKTVNILLEDIIEEPVNLAIDTDGMNPGEAMFSWEMPAPPSTETFTENWDGYTDWTTNLSPWTTIDQLGGATWGASDFDFPPLEGTAFAWGIMNPAQTSPPISGTHPAHSGSKYVFSVGQTSSPAAENKWLISPQMEVTEESVLSFFAKSITDLYGLERMRVFISTTGTNPADFTQISPGNYMEVPTTWTQYSYPLGTYAGQPIYFAVVNVSNDAFMLFLDSFQVTEVAANRETELANRAFRGFNIYLNDMETPVEIELQDTEHMFTGVPGGTHTAGVQAVYSSGASEIVTIEFEMDVTEMTVTFHVTDEHGSPLEDAVITLGTVENDPGDYIFENVEPGEHSYTVSKMCYLTKTGSVNLQTPEDADVHVSMDTMPGDANGDGTVNVNDMILVAQYYTHQEPEPFCFNNADVLNNGHIDVLDIIAIALIFLQD